MRKKRTSIIKMATFSMYAFVCGVIGVGLPKTINFINKLDEGAFYGYLASYMITGILFWTFTKDFTFNTTRESIFDKIKKISEKNSKANKK